MNNKIILLLILGLLVSCSNHSVKENKTEQASKQDVNIKQESKKRELTEEEKHLISLFKQEKYDEISVECIGFENQTQKDFYNIAYAFRKYEEFKNKSYVKEIGGYDYDDEKGDYREIISSLEKVSYIPLDIEKEVNELLEWAKSKYRYISKAEIQKENAGKISIGMTEEEVLERWGKPLDINKTITQNGISEQWVYPNNQYLYFEDGVLTSIQQ
ncbi:DUF2845 domain-containing protein [Anoxybacillus salavatliensis]|uniref:DUF2845 domain-containing protein n=1 Tax=Anoxybacillus gonensis TaxID=198467 RepID=UPI00214B3844|nr:DUF2845 domain-containing protein [Anoxybacillus gonensis]MCQ5364148.1 DUF2845 domain-containing protein [Anoxybacillus gonensis]